MKPYPEAYIDYLLYFHAQRDYFECHEVMEEFWKEHPGDIRSRTYVALIQIAVGMYHIRRGNRNGAVKMLQSAGRNAEAPHVLSLGLNPDEASSAHSPGLVFYRERELSIYRILICLLWTESFRLHV